MTKQIGLLGRGIGYSLSPQLHGAALKAVGLGWEYLLLDTEPENLAPVVDKLRTPNWAGINVTAPYKQIIMKLLDEVEGRAKDIGAVNTIVKRRGRLVGCNTDVPGLARDLARLNIQLPGKNITVLGAGGAAAAVLALAGESRVSIVCRHSEQGRALARSRNISAQVLPWEPPPPSDLLFNCTPPASGWQGFTAESAVIYDLNYHEPAPPRGNYYNGLGMLVFQAAESFRLWTGFDTVTEMAAAVKLKI